MNDSMNYFNEKTGLPDENLNGLGGQPVDSSLPELPTFKSLVQKFGATRVISTILGMLLVIGGVGAGVVLVIQPQLLNQKAFTVDYGSCGSGNICKAHIAGSYCTAAGGSSKSCVSGAGLPGNCCVPSSSCFYSTDCVVGVCKNYKCVPIVNLTPISNCNTSSGNVYLSQKDPRWNNLPVAQGECDFEYIGCAPTTIAAVVSTKQKSCFSPYETYQKVTPELDCNKGIGAYGAAEKLKKLGISTVLIPTGTDPAANKKAIIDAFKTSGGKPIMVGVNIIEPPNYLPVNHVTLIVGYNPTTGNPIFNDPLSGENIELESEGYTVKWGNADAVTIN